MMKVATHPLYHGFVVDNYPTEYLCFGEIFLNVRLILNKKNGLRT